MSRLARTSRVGPAAQAIVASARPWSNVPARIILLGMLEVAA